MSDASHRLHREIEAAKALLANFADIVGADDDFAADMVEGATNLNEAIDEVVQHLVEDQATIHGIDAIVEGLTRRRDRVEARIANMRTALLSAMEHAGRKKVEHPAVTLSLRSVAPSVTVIDEALIPSSFWKASDPKLDRRALLAALKAKENVPGAVLSNGGTTIAVSWS